MDMVIEIIFFLLYGLSYIEPHLKKIRKRIERPLKPFYKAILIAIDNAIHRFVRSFMDHDGPLIIIVSGLLWIVALIYGAGIGKAYNVYGKTITLASICFFYQFAMKKRFSVITASTFIVFVLVLWEYLYTTVLFNVNYREYVLLYFIVILYSIWEVSEKQMTIISVIYGLAGAAVLGVVKFTTYFAGWDGNSVSSVAFFSYIVMAAGFANVKTQKIKVYLIIYSCIYFVWLQLLNARNAMLFSIVQMLCMLKVIPLKKILNEKNILIILLIPLMVALFVIIICNMPFVDNINMWSIRHFRKPIFNGRDDLWMRGVTLWLRNFLFGTGTLKYNWHNSAVMCLSGTGILGYVLWLYIIRKLCIKAIRNIDDDIVLGTLSGFLIIWIQQSVEQGLIGQQGNPLVFVLLGLMLARINTLNGGAKG